MKILGIHFSYNKETWKWRKLYQRCSENKKVLKSLNVRTLNLEGKIIIFKTISKITHFSIATNVSAEMSY